MTASQKDAVRSIAQRRGITTVNMRLAKESFGIEPYEP